MKQKRGLQQFSSRQRKQIAGDGNCFFRALSYILFGTEAEHKELRLTLADFISENKEIFKDWSFEADFERHADVKRRWATEVELKAASTYLQRPIYTYYSPVESKYRWLIISPLSLNVSHQLPLQIPLEHIELCNTGTHYDCIADCNGYFPDIPPNMECVETVDLSEE